MVGFVGYFKIGPVTGECWFERGARARLALLGVVGAIGEARAWLRDGRFKEPKWQFGVIDAYIDCLL